MNINKMIDQLRAELATIQQALTVLENLSGAKPGPGKRKPFSEATRRKMAAAQRRRWAAYRKDQKQSGN